ncbi:hypothetical protein BN159_4283 [Streptomyces davaonensis JCM 4913]|uniref:Uncharacterized protein n=1 Tax=Streptomyces davaonensis (strain DSM 101723 / JCM 4913 / KCC S-0913 / 768) TaxID=1214101 RepID=K4R6B2_STRDJ|nr:type II toxin-antitoxin system Phd/YefM family antitoxin [Streptomyces davaonensis]CCK28662.1 hypothetical protein BN159_4283 [Streptomyces davaonensis JCM 4913]
MILLEKRLKPSSEDAKQAPVHPCTGDVQEPTPRGAHWPLTCLGMGAYREVPWSDVGITDARGQIGKLASRVEHGAEIVYLTNGRRRVAALIGFREAERWIKDDSECVSNPGAVREATNRILALERGEVRLESVAAGLADEDLGEVVGGLITLLTALYLPYYAQGEGGRIRLLTEDGRDAHDQFSLADLVFCKILEGRHLGSARTAVPVVAGSFWAMQADMDPAEWRNALKLPITEDEVQIWFYSVHLVGSFIDMLMGSGTVEGVLLRACEYVEQRGVRNW